jgi:hypothetical protein
MDINAIRNIRDENFSRAEIFCVESALEWELFARITLFFFQIKFATIITAVDIRIVTV